MEISCFFYQTYKNEMYQTKNNIIFVVKCYDLYQNYKIVMGHMLLEKENVLVIKTFKKSKDCVLPQSKLKITEFTEG